MKSSYWIAIGLITGFLSGLVFGMDYSVAGAGIGLIAGGAIFLVMRNRG
ncbi:MAG: hypothetical protein AB3N20_08250 [Rhizobiaceae bacterium]